MLKLFDIAKKNYMSITLEINELSSNLRSVHTRLLFKRVIVEIGLAIERYI